MKRTLIFALTAALLFALCACGKNPKALPEGGDGGTAADPALGSYAPVGTGGEAAPGAGEPDIAYIGPADPLTEPPNAGVAYTNGEFATCVYATRGNYHWEGTIACGLHPFETMGQEYLAVINRTDTEGSLTLNFYHTLESYTLHRYAETAAGPEEYEELTLSGDTIPLPDDGVSYLYVIYATYDLGTCEYMFFVQA